MANTRVAPGGAVVVLDNKESGRSSHEWGAQCELGRRVAELIGYEFAGAFDPACKYSSHVYFVPGDTLTGVASAHQLGIHGEQDLFGGVVPYPCMATKTITHGLPRAAAKAPPGWPDGFCRAVADVVLPGYSAFDHGDALAAGMELLARGAVRIKKAGGIGGIGQTVARDRQQLEQQLLALDAEGALHEGLVLETNLNQVNTLSVGQARVGDLVASYYGVQRLTTNNKGAEVYGGSDLVLVRGDYDALLHLQLPPEVRTAVVQAGVYHAAALAGFPGMFVSRSNYDIAQGYDDRGDWRSGVLEQSWRAGGASGAELAALAAFRADDKLQSARASTTELYGEQAELPEGAIIYYRGNDARVGPITKYARLASDADS